MRNAPQAQQRESKKRSPIVDTHEEAPSRSHHLLSADPLLIGGREGEEGLTSVKPVSRPMSFDGEEKQWLCGRSAVANLHRVSSIVREISEPCLHQSPIKVTKMLKPDKWQAAFDSDGKVFGFKKVLKMIVLGGVDSSIRSEVWEFLLGCYTPGSTAEYRRELRMARRERYKDLIKQCQMMHSSIGTGSLAYIVGSKIMDARTFSKDDRRNEASIGSGRTSDGNSTRLDFYCEWDNSGIATSLACEHESSSDSADIVDVRRNMDSAAYDSLSRVPSSDPYSSGPLNPEREAHDMEDVNGDYFNFPPLPVTDLFRKGGQETNDFKAHDDRLSMQHNLRLEDESMHSFQINNNVDLVVESNSMPSNSISPHIHSEIEMVHPDVREPVLQSNKLEYRTGTLNKLRTPDAHETLKRKSTSQGGAVSEDRVSEWLWTLHRIVVDVVRTDSHLEFYEDTKNLARMSDILAVYAWVDPATGMSDLLSPFIVLYEDNADAFWCFEMLLRRLRGNFQMEGPTGVMKQLEVLWQILELTDKEIYAHLSHIGAESLHFAFRMLLVLFRRELSFNEALCMWEMMWAADFSENIVSSLEENCLEPLSMHIPKVSGEIVEEKEHNDSDGMKDGVKEDQNNSNSKAGLQSKQRNLEESDSENGGMKSTSIHHFCGLTKNFWSKNAHFQISSALSSTKRGDDELSVFCVGAILIMNRHKIIKETRSIDDLIKIFNDNMLNINVKRCIRTAIKLRKRYFCKIIKSKSPSACNSD